MLRYGVFVFLFVATVIIFFVGLFMSILPLVLVGAVMLVALFFTRRIFIPTQES
jgi:TRAP-type C4-dicarboxylate transport system permease large subunit